MENNQECMSCSKITGSNEKQKCGDHGSLCHACPGNVHPGSQISPEQAKLVEKQIETMFRKHGVAPDMCMDIFRVGYESGWDDALTTKNATTYSRIDRDDVQPC